MTTVLHSFPVWLPQTQTWMYNQVRYLPRDIEGHVLCERTENLDQFRVPNIHSLAEAPAWRYYWDKGLRKPRVRRHFGFTVRITRNQRASIVHSHFGNVGWADMGAARRAGVKHVVSFYGLDVNFLPRQDPRWHVRYRALFDHVDAVLCEGSHMGASVIALGCPERKIRIHHLGVALEDIPFKPYQWRRGEPLRVLIAASFREKKGIPFALEALGRLQDQVPLKITVIGDAGDDPRAPMEKQKILTTVDRCRLGPRVRMLGYQPHACFLEEARRHHIFLSPSVTASDGDSEGGAPVSLMEMAATGMMVVSTVHCDIPEVVRHGVTGFLAKERDIDELVKHLEWLVNSPGAWLPMLETARKHIESEYSAEVQGRRLGALYEDVVCSQGLA